MAVPRRVIVPLIVACALFMQNLDSTALATALPAMAISLGQTPLRLHLAITVFMLSLAAFLPVSGWVADKFGARTIFRLAIIVFMLASIMCGLASNFEMLLSARAIQGAGGALMVPVGRLILLRSVPKSELIAAMALMGMPALIGPIIGPVVAGLILTVTTWRWIFWLNVPIGILGIVLATIFIDDVREPDVSPFDWPGFVLSSFGLCGTLFGLDALTLITLACVPASWFVLYRTRFGLRLRAAGENPRALEMAGVSVRRIRYAGVAICGFLCGLGGAYLSIVQAAGFLPQMTAGKGFIALAALVFAKWRPVGALFTCLLFGMLDAAAIRLQGTSIPGIGAVPVQAIQALPYLMTVILLAGWVGRASAPQASGVPYVTEN